MSLLRNALPLRVGVPRSFRSRLNLGSLSTSAHLSPRHGERSFSASVRSAELTKEQKDIVKSTAPVLAEHGIAITTHFYQRMLKAHPALKNTFNLTHQATGAQSAALAHSVWAYANHIDDLGALTSVVSRIGQKHASLHVTPDQYAIVGEHLLKSIKEVLGDAVNEKVMGAWKAAYDQLATIMIGFEDGLYRQAKAASGGWVGWRQFVVEKKVVESEDIISFYLAPADKQPLPSFKPGQFVSVRCFVPELGVYQPRQYTLSNTPGDTHFRISVKREQATGPTHPQGKISTALHETLPQGSTLDVSPPFGDFTLDVDATTPVVLLSAGVGLTPMMSMLNTIVAQSASPRKVLFIHAARNARVRAMKQHLADVVAANKQVSRLVYLENVDPQKDVKGDDYDYEGRVDLERIKDKVVLPGVDVYLCGPKPFMKVQDEALRKLGVPKEKIHMEVFGAS